jgi:hypothetical protein
MLVRVYKNLHRNCYSVQKKYEDGQWRLWGWHDFAVLHDPKFVVREGGRQRVIQTRKKNVHAFIQGDLQLPWEPVYTGVFGVEIPPEFSPEKHKKIKYDPYTDEFFHIDGISMKNSDLDVVYLSKDGVYI